MREQMTARFVNYRSRSENINTCVSYVLQGAESQPWLRERVTPETPFLWKQSPLVWPRNPQGPGHHGKWYAGPAKHGRTLTEPRGTEACARPQAAPPCGPETQAAVWAHTDSFPYSDPSQGQDAQHHRPPLPVTGPRCLGLGTQEGPRTPSSVWTPPG